MNLRNLSRPLVTTSRRPTDVGLAVARNLLIRALRRYDLHHVLSGCPCTVGFILNNPADGETFVEAGRTLHRNQVRSKRVIRPEILHWDNEATVRRTRDKDLGKSEVIPDAPR